MTVHLLKLCVGVETVQELADWQSERMKRLKRERKQVELCHRTLQTPKRRDEVCSQLAERDSRHVVVLEEIHHEPLRSRPISRNCWPR
jgi:hypothetical protein